ncbi:MAG: M20/M25/M40 family metallo-hydrolase [Planctomycetota bacterium]
MRLKNITTIAAAIAMAASSWMGSEVIGQTATADSDQATQESTVSREAMLKRVTYDIKYMSSDEMGGRQPGTPGIKLCEDYIVAEYKKAGIKPLEDGTYFQEMEVRGSRGVDKEKTSLVLTGPDGKTQELKLGKQYQQLLGRAGFDITGELVFVGYGIEAEDLNYNDYEKVDVKDKIVVLVRMEPQQEKDDSVFDGTDTTRYASGRIKANAARKAGAKAILMVNDSLTAGEDAQDDLIAPDRFGTTTMPFAQVKRNVINKILKSNPLVAANGNKIKNLKGVEKLIDETLEPISQPMEGWSATFKSDFKQNMIKTYNIVGVVEGEGPNADETIVIGGHYDHLGMGQYGSRAGGRREIHNGADDNATGTAAVIELARRFQASGKKPGRRLVFICFTAEEMGLLGARHYVDNPIFPLENTIAMVNFDMIGWLRNNRLTLYNWDTSPDFDSIFEASNEGIDFELVKPTNRFGGSDHLPFNGKRIPNTFIHTGTNAVYHTPEDDFEAIDCEGALKVIDYSENFVRRLADMEKRPSYGRAEPFRLGVLLDDENDIVTVERVTEGSAAEVAGLQAGDVVLEVDGEKITKRRQMSLIIRRDKGKTVKVKLKRDDAEMTLKVLLKNPG